MSKTISVVYKNNEEKKFITAGLYLFFAFLGASGTVLSFASCFHLEKEAEFYLMPIIITVLMCSVFLVEKVYKKAIFFFGSGLGLYVFMQWEKIAGGFVTTANIIISDVNESYLMGFNKLSYPEFEELYKENDVFLIVAVVLITMLICFFVMGYASAFGCILVSMPFTVFGIFFDLFPKLWYLVMAVTFWVVAAALSSSGRKGRRRSDAAAYNALFLVIAILGIFLVSQKVMPGENYNKSQKQEEIREFLNQFASEITSEVLTNIGTKESETGIGQGEFGYQEEVRFTGRTMLEVRVPFLKQNIYLKSKEYNEYVGNGWEDNEDWFQNYFHDSYEEMDRDEWPQNITSSHLNGVKDALAFYGIGTQDYFQMVKEYEVTIDNINDLENGFVPYGAVIEGHSLERDILPDLNDMKHYQFQVYAGNVEEFITKIDTDLLISYWEEAINQNWQNVNWYNMVEFYNLASAEKKYAAYVRKAYTQVPAELESLLRDYVPTVVEYEYEPAMKFVQEVQRMFLNEYSYTLAPGRVPEGRDGVEYFLTENKKGYCVYFASSATLIFRMAGIPARYVEGYVVTPDMAKINRRETQEIRRAVGDEAMSEEIEYVTVTVPDSKAHAWVEIYVSGYGWIPVEVTPGYYSENEFVSSEDENLAEEETTTKQEQETESQSKAPDKEEIPQIENGQDWKELGRMLLAMVGFAIPVVAILFVAGRWYRNGKEKYLAIVDEERGVSAKERACLAWWYMEAVMKFLRKPLPENVSCEEQKRFLKENTEFFSKRELDGKIDYIIKAYYGNEALTDEEMMGIAEMIRELRKETYESLPLGRRLCFKYIKRL